MTDYMKAISKERRAKREEIQRRRLRRPHWRFEDLEIWKRAVELRSNFI
jgi:hypothetical protein